LNYTSAGVGTPRHLRMVILKHISGVDLTHVPFKSPADMARALSEPGRAAERRRQAFPESGQQ